MHTHQHVLTEEELECLRGCSSYDQYSVMRRRFEASVCAFCQLDRSRNKVRYENDHWIAWENIFRHDRACSVMLVVASRSHWRTLKEITREGWGDMYGLCQWMENTYDIPGGMLFIRHGDMRYNVGTVPHLHWNEWVPDRTGEVMVPIAKKLATRKKNNKRMLEFASQYEAGEISA